MRPANPHPALSDPTASQLQERWEAESFGFWKAQGWDPGGSNCLLAVSGGADSTALLHFFRLAVQPKFGGEISIAHINHGLRPDADRDEAFVGTLCQKWNLPFFVRKLNPRQRPVRESVEMWARRERYQFYAECAQKAQAKWILTGHHRDDLVETVFQRLGRGTGPRGLAGIPFQREGGIIRPLLSRSRMEILAYLEMLQSPWQEDASNGDIGINRNWYRHVFLPQLRAQEIDLDARVFKFAMQLQGIGRGLDALEEEKKILHWDAQSRPFLHWDDVHEHIQQEDQEGLAYWLKALLLKSCSIKPKQSVTKEILAEFFRQWHRNPSHLHVDLSKTIAFKSENSGIYVKTSENWAQQPLLEGKKGCIREVQKVILDGAIGEFSWQWGNRTYRLSAKKSSRPRNLVYPASSEGRAIFDADLFSCTLSIRNRLDGDCFSPFGVNSRSRKLKAFLNEKKIPIEMRNELPIFVAGDTLAWVPGFGISEFFKVTDSTSFILELVLKCENP